MIEFELPLAFLLLPLPLLIFWLLPSAPQSQNSVLKVPFYQELTEFKVAQNARGKTSLARFLLLLLIWVLLITAAAKPVWLGDDIVLPAKGRDLMLAVDVSGSMQQKDMHIEGQAVDRLTLVKSVLKTFIEKRQGDRLGLILFGSNAYLQAPLTFDRKTLNDFLMEAEIGIAGEATAIGDAIGLAIKRLHDRPVDSRVLILLTDGSNNAGAVEPLQAARLAKEKSLKIYTIGVGADQMEVPGIFGSPFFSQNINPSADLDENTLKQIAEMTGGLYFRAKDAQSLANIYQRLDELEAVDADHLSFRPKKSLFFWFLGTAIIISWLYCFFILSGNRLQNIKNRTRGKPSNTLFPDNTDIPDKMDTGVKT